MIFSWPDENKISYVLDHFKLYYDLPVELEMLFRIGPKHEFEEGIVFKVSTKEFVLEDVLWYDEVPLLFPDSNQNEFVTHCQSKLIFHHDILKSAFYLLSGYQEYNTNDRDHFDRFPYKSSIQHRLEIIDRPIVNYYFDIIYQEINKFAKANQLPEIKKRHLLTAKNQDYAFMLSHDVDQLEFYTFSYVVFKLKQFFGLSKSDQSYSAKFSLLIDALAGWIAKRNPAYDFEDFLLLEKEFGIEAVYFFLDKDKKHHDAKYKITDKQVVDLIAYLKDSDAEIGMHGVCDSSIDKNKHNAQLEKLIGVVGNDISGMRQHRLMFQNPDTVGIHHQSKLQYDSTLCFAEHEGFRNSFCHPFKVFDHERNIAADIWEFPLNVMDVTLFHYQKYDFETAKMRIRALTEEIKKFNGLLTILWHNGFNNEKIRPGVSGFYREMIQEITENGGVPMKGKTILKKLTDHVG